MLFRQNKKHKLKKFKLELNFLGLRFKLVLEWH